MMAIRTITIAVFVVAVLSSQLVLQFREEQEARNNGKLNPNVLL